MKNSFPFYHNCEAFMCDENVKKALSWLCTIFYYFYTTLFTHCYNLNIVKYFIGILFSIEKPLEISNMNKQKQCFKKGSVIASILKFFLLSTLPLFLFIYYKVLLICKWILIQFTLYVFLGVIQKFCNQKFSHEI